LPGPLGKSESIFERPIFMGGKKIIEKMKNGLDKKSSYFYYLDGRFKPMRYH